METDKVFNCKICNQDIHWSEKICDHCFDNEVDRDLEDMDNRERLHATFFCFSCSSPLRESGLGFYTCDNCTTDYLPFGSEAGIQQLEKLNQPF